MRGLPHMSVFVPADCKECNEVIKYAAENFGPMYIRIPRSNVCDVFDENYKFDCKHARLLEDGVDATVITNGETLAEVIEVVENLKGEGYSIQVLHVPVVKPIDANSIVENAKKTNLVITVENHSVIGGLGSAVCEVLSENCPTKVHRIGVNDTFGQSGNSDLLLDFYGLSSKKLTESIRKTIDENRQNKK